MNSATSGVSSSLPHNNLIASSLQSLASRISDLFHYVMTCFRSLFQTASTAWERCWAPRVVIPRPPEPLPPINSVHPPINSVHPPIDFSSPGNASLAFSLLNTGFAGFEMGNATSLHALSLMIQGLQQNKHRFSPEDQQKIEQLLMRFQAAYELKIRTNQLRENCTRIEQFEAVSEQFQTLILQQLQQGKPVYLSSGWAGEPGHHIALELIAHVDSKSGELMIEGRIQNRGEGQQHHQAFLKGTKIAYNPEIHLEPVSVKQLQNSHFLQYLFQLQFHQKPHNPQDRTQPDTLFSERDFYQTFLPSWPGQFREQTHATPRIGQRGPTCAIAPLLTQMSEQLGDDAGKIAKFYLTKYTWELYENSVGITAENREQLRSLLPKFARRAQKLHQQGRLTQEDLEEINSFCQRMRKAIATNQQICASTLRNPPQNIPIHLIEDVNYGCQFPQAPAQPRSVAPPSSVSLPSMHREKVEDFIAACDRLAKDAQKNGSLQEAQDISLFCLRSLPSLFDDAAWKSIKNPWYVRMDLNNLIDVLLSSAVRTNGRLVITPHHASLIMKVFGISYRLTKDHLPPNVRAFYKNGFTTLLNERFPALFSPLIPSDLAAVREVIHFIDQDIVSSPEAVLQGPANELPQPDSDSTTYKERNISDLQEALKYPDLSYLYFSENFPEHDWWGVSSSIPPLQMLTRRYSSPSGYEDNYLWLRTSFLSLALAFDFRGKKSSDGTSLLMHSATFHRGNACLRDLFRRLLPQYAIDEYHRGVFADTFPQLAAAKPEAFASALMNHRRSKNTLPYHTQNELSQFNESETIPIEREVTINLNPLEIQDLLAVRTVDALPLLQIEHYFSQNLSHLELPFFQSLFMALLFKADNQHFTSLIADTLARPSGKREIGNFFAFLRHSLQTARATKSWSTYCFLLRIYAAVLSHCLYDSHDPSYSHFFRGLERELQETLSLLQSKKFSGSSAALLHHSLTAMIPYLSPYESSKSCLAQLITIRQNIQLSPVDSSISENIHLMDDAQLGNFQLTHLPSLQQLAGKPSLVQGMLPEWIVASDSFKSLFSTSYPAQEITEGCYEFMDEKGISYRIQTSGDRSFHILRAFPQDNGQIIWCFFEPGFRPYDVQEKSRHPCSSTGYLQRNTIIWYEMPNPSSSVSRALVLNKTTDEILCYLTPTQIIHPKYPHLVLAKNYEHPLLQALERLTSKTEILAWKRMDTGELVRIECKEFQLSFTIDRDAAGRIQWKSSEYVGYSLSLEQRSLHVEPFSHYLILSNEEGEQKIVCPSRKFTPQKIALGSKKQPKIDQDPARQLFVYDIDREGSIVLPESPDPLLYLLYLALEREAYSWGFQIVHKLKQHPIHWNKSALQLARYVESDKINKHPHACVLRLQVKHLLLSHSSRLPKDQKASLTSDYLSYLNQLNNIPPSQRLTALQEKAFCDVLQTSLVSQQNLQVLQKRLEYLEPSLPSVSPPMLGWMALEGPAQMPHSWEWIDQRLQQAMLHAQSNPEPIFFSLRPGTSFFRNFLCYYDILQRQDAKQEQLVELLHACRYDPNPHIQSMRAFLVGVHADPGKFPPVQELLVPSSEIVPKAADGQTQIAISLQHWYSRHQESGLFIDRDPERQPLEIGNLEDAAILEPTLPETIPPFRAAEFAESTGDLLQMLQEQGLIAIENSPVHTTNLQKKLAALRELEHLYSSLAKNKDAAIAREFARLLAGIQTLIPEIELQLARVDTTPMIAMQDEHVQKTLAALRRRSALHQEQLRVAQEEIEGLLHDYPEELLLEVHAELLRPLTFAEAILYFGRQEDEPFYRANPSLTEEKLLEIKQKIGIYLLHKLNIQKEERFYRDLQKASKIRQTFEMASVEYQVQKMHALLRLQERRAYVPQANPHFMVFEVFADICLREEQLHALQNLTDNTENARQIIEARTGFGKSKALIPLWLYLTGKQRKGEETPGASMMTVPDALYAQQVSYLKKVLGSAFEQSVFAFRFTRKQGDDLQYLRYLNQQLDQAAAKGACILTTVNSLHGLLNLKIKEYLSLEDTEENREKLQELRALRHKAKRHLSNFFDESRESFDIRRHFDYAIGAPQTVCAAHCETIKHIYQVLIALELEIPLDFVSDKKSENGSKPVFDETYYEQEIKPRLAEQLLRDLIAQKILPDPGKSWKFLFNHLMGGEYRPEIAPYFEKLSDANKQSYMIYRNQLNIYLRRTLMRQCNGRYGLAFEKTGNRFAYPFDRGVAQLSSQFSTLDDLLNFTVQANLKTPFTFQQVAQFIQQLKLRWNQAEDVENFMNADLGYRCYQKITEKLPHWPPLLECTSDHIHMLEQFLNDPKNKDAKLQLIAHAVLPQITIYAQKLSSTAHNLVGAIEHAYGASGTVNTDTLPTQLKTLKDPKAPVGAIVSMWQDSQESIYSLRESQAAQMLRETLSKYPQFRVIIDVNSTFRDLRSERDIAEIIFANTAFSEPPIHALSYYDEEGNNLLFVRPPPGEKLGDPIAREHSTIPLEQIFIFMRQSATIGADTPMSAAAKALVTVGRDTQRDLFLQGVGRMRGLATGQTVGFLIQEKDARAFSPEAIRLSDILRHVGLNQGEQRGQDLFFNLQLLFQNLVEQQFWQAFDHPDCDLEECRMLFSAMQSFFLLNTLEDPIASLQQAKGEVPVKQAVQQMQKQFRQKLEKLVETNPSLHRIVSIDGIMTSFQKFINYGKLPPMIHMGSAGEYTSEAEVGEVEEETVGEGVAEADQDQEQEREQTTTNALPAVHFTPGKPSSGWHYRQEGIPLASTFASRFSPMLQDFFASPNFCAMTPEKTRPKSILKTAYAYLVVCRGDRWTVTLLDQYDTRSVIAQMNEDEPLEGQSFYLMSSTGKMIAQNSASPFDQTRWHHLPHHSLLTKIFSRRLTFTQREIHYLASLPPKAQQDYFDFLNQEICICWPPVGPILRGLQERVQKMRTQE